PRGTPRRGSVDQGLAHRLTSWLLTCPPVRAVVRQDLDRAMQRPDERELREQLARLRAEHRELDTKIATEAASPVGDQLQIKRLKNRKLVLKDRTAAIEDQLFPDIIA